MGRDITLTAADGHKLEAWRADPPDTWRGKPRGGVVVVQEIFGVNNHIRDVCDRFAAAGYSAIAPAYFDRIETGVQMGYESGDITSGLEYVGKLRWDNIIIDTDAAVAELRGAGKVAVIGYCWGGTVAWLAACRLDIDAAACYYGRLINDFNDENPRVPTILHYGDEDASIPMSKVDEVAKAHPDVDVHVYAGPHGFNCDRRGAYREDSAKLANQRTMALFEQCMAS